MTNREEVMSMRLVTASTTKSISHEECIMTKSQFKSCRSMYRSMMKVLESSWDAQQQLRAMQPLMCQCEPAGDLPVSVKVWCHKIIADYK